jgi:hypothetical protein
MRLEFCQSWRTTVGDDNEEAGLALWGEVDLDLDPRHLSLKWCSVCGAPATSASRDLRTQVRTFHCAAHRSEKAR